MSDELKVGYGRFDPNPQPLTPGQSKILDALKALPLATFAERREAEIATLRTQLAAMTAERDEWKQAVKESQDRYARMMAMRDTCAAERNAEYAKVAVLRDALTEISKYPPIHPIATAVGQMARNALEQTQ